MKYPFLTQKPVSRDLISVFDGYDHNLRIPENRFYDMTNLSSSDYPALSPRQKRGVLVSANVRGMIAKEELCYIDGSEFVMGDQRIDLDLPDDGVMRYLTAMGAYVIIMPDKKYVNTADLSDYGDIEAHVATRDVVTFSLCQRDGADYGEIPAQASPPASPASMALWIDTSSTPHTLRRYSATAESWISIATTYVKISSPGIGKPFSVHDTVTVSGITADGLSNLNTTLTVWARGDDYIVVTGIPDTVASQVEPVSVSRRMPNMDYLVESQNRLWGCRYGTDIHGNMVNEIYACKQGDFRNWQSYLGISTDSYAVSVGSDGPFTGAIVHLGYPLFFKETCLHKVYGTYPANYQIQTTACRGVQRGSDRSLAIVGEVLYYKSISAVCAYDGALPVEISQPLGNLSYAEAVAGTLGSKYYISMADESGVYHLFVYDTRRAMWHREDNTHVRLFCFHRGELYFADALGKAIRTVTGTGKPESTPVYWMCETGLIGMDTPDKKRVSRLDIRMSLEVDSRIDVFIQYDSSGTWEQVYAMIGDSLESFPVPVRPKRCDHLRLRIEGVGMAKIFSICKSTRQGSDV